MRTYKTGYAVVTALVAVALMVPSVQAAQLNNISVGRSQDFTVVTLFGDAQAAVSHQAIEAKGGKPDRIVVDLTGVEHALPKNNFDELPAGSISRIRTSQFAVSPEPVVRVVLDLATAAAYKLETEGNNVRIMISLPSDPPMASVWSAKNLPVMAQSEGARPAVAAKASAPEQSEPVQAVPLPLAMKPDMSGSAEPAKPAAGTNYPSAPSTAAPEVGIPEPKRVVTAKTTAPAKQDAEATSPSSANSAATKLTDVPPASPDAPEVPLPMPKHRGAEVIDYNFPRPGAMAVTDAPAEAMPAEPTQAKTAPTPAKTAPAPKKAVTKQATADPANAEPSASKQALAGNEAAEPPNQTEPEPKAEPKRAVTKDQAPQSTPATARPATEVEGADYAEAENGSAPIASLTTLPPMEADLPSVVPARSKIVYHTNGRRDPFLPLLQVGAAYNAAALPDVGNLRLVGLLHDVDDSWGLFEDANGFGYILRKGDRVKNGRLNKLTQSRAYFQLNEFGWSRSVELELEPEG